MNKQEPIKTLESIDLSYCTILDKNLSGVKFTGAKFRGARFNNVDFTGASFVNCDFTESRMTDCMLDHVQAKLTDFSLTIFEACSVANMQMRECRLEAVSPYSTDLSKINMDEHTNATLPAEEQVMTDEQYMKEWTAICKAYCDKVGAELLFVNLSDFGCMMPDGELCHINSEKLAELLNELSQAENPGIQMGGI